MSSSRRSLLGALLRGGLAVGGLALLLPGCGFQPVYGRRPNNGMADQLSRVKIASIPERTGQHLRNLLIDRFYRDGRPVEPDYTLNIGLSATDTRLGIQRDDTATRSQLTLNANYSLVDPTGAVVYTDSSRSFIGYSILGNQYATLVNEQDAYERGINQLAEDITTRIGLFLAREPVAPPPAS